MKSLLINLISIIIVCSCINCGKTNIFIEPELDSVLTKFIQEYPDDSIYTLTFYNYNNKQFLNIQCSDIYYDGNFIDGCFEKNGKIIIYCSINKSWQDSLINIPASLQCKDSLAKYCDWNTINIYYDRPLAIKQFRIISKKEFKTASQEDFKSRISVRDKNVITHEGINQVLNNYLNENDYFITYVRFNEIDGKKYIAIGQDNSYNRKHFSGMFYRNGRIIVLYDLIKIKNQELVKESQLHTISEISDYKELSRKVPLHSEKKYEIISRGIVRKADYDNKHYMDI